MEVHQRADVPHSAQEREPQVGLAVVSGHLRGGEEPGHDAACHQAAGRSHGVDALLWRRAMGVGAGVVTSGSSV